MEMTPWFELAFVSLFHIIGAGAVGNAVYRLWLAARGEEGGTVFVAIFFLIWGTLFGCGPLAIGFDPQRPVWFLPAQVTIWSVAFIVAAFFQRRLLAWARPLFSIQTGLIVLGGVFMLAGVIAGSVALKNEGALLTALLVGAVFGMIGFGIFLLGLVQLLRKFRA
ncbi:MAG: hypothetical protein D6796_13540 [Caldilineae bacterium]|nr:MAG: hypothetical protein D6796_13540 [Caldilineae bacterium]